ncbi:hypothetical protein [Pseudomonas citronellolis]|uniref:hypothetical protein n=1 Tax=Pseudomonas citronellolis TaxID=53408 RepID=UPI0021C0EB25|nr:hypothetical protein [Pseudomonas citronellolis]UXJ50116.1 hypothetical protein N5P21_19205 [Pseudomonas citronellolis]
MTEESALEIMRFLCFRDEEVNMRFFLAVFTVFVAFAASADDSGQINELRVKCEKEKVSMFRENNGTPSCDRLDKIMREGKKPNDGAVYRWNGAAGKYCYYNAAGEVMSCP